MTHILPRYLRRRFLTIFSFCLLGIIVIFLVVDLIENLDHFIDNNVPWKTTIVYYLYFIPYIIIIVLPVASLMTTVFSIGIMARYNEIIALKALGYSLYSIMRTLLILGLLISLCSFVLAETIVVHTNRKIEVVKKEYLHKKRTLNKALIRNIIMQDPPDKIISIGTYYFSQKTAYNVKIETYSREKLISKLDTRVMKWDKNKWVVNNGYIRNFYEDSLTAKLITKRMVLDLNFAPRQLFLSQVKPEEMTIKELLWFLNRIRQSGGKVHQWLTQLNLRISYPVSNAIIILFSIPFVYNRRKKSLAVGFGISLGICFIYFGLIKIGQTMGENGGINPFWGAWLGNIIMGVGGVFNLIKTRK